MEEQAQYHRQMENEYHQQKMVFDPEKILEQFADVATLVEDGHESALDALIFIKQVKDNLLDLEAQMKPLAMEEAGKYPEKTFGYKGFEFTKIAGRATYSFSHINQYNDILKQKKAIESDSKAAYQALLKGKQYVTDDGEVVEPAEVKYSADTISLKPSK